MANKGSGSAPRPIAQHKLEQGKLYGDLARREKLEPQTSVTPECPVEFTHREIAAWDIYSNILRELGLFTLANAPLLRILSVLHAEADAAQDDIRFCEGILEFVPTDKDALKQKADARKIRQENYRQMMTIYKDLGLSSMGMAKLGSLLAKEKEDEPDEFFD